MSVFPKGYEILTSEGLTLARAKSRDEAFRMQDAIQREMRKPVFVQPVR